MADIVGFGISGAYVSLATGGGNFAPMQLKLNAFGTGNSVGGWISDNQYPRELADVNGDHMADIVGFGISGAYVSLATGGGNFAPMQFKLDAFGTSNSVGGWISDDQYPRELADVNGDGMADIVGFGISGVYVALATGGGNFAPMQLKLNAFGTGNNAGGWTSDDRYPRELADVNGDHMADIVGFGEAGVYVSLATGNGNLQPLALTLAEFAPAASGWTSQTIYPRHLADISHDGAADIVGFGQNGVYEALSNGFFTV
jgi:hypothetical protein